MITSALPASREGRRPTRSSDDSITAWALAARRGDADAVERLGRCSARSWLLSIARRAVVDSFRHAAKRPRLSDVHDWLPAAERAQSPHAPGFDDGVALLDLLTALPAERREAFVLTQLLELPYAEVAVLSGCPVGTVRSRVARARATLLNLLTEADPAAGV
ncbi:sigma-70 family RNA polymerase sigma factor [Streptomyces sp. NPDC004365]